MDLVAVALELVLSTALLVAASQKLLDAARWRAARLEIMPRMPGPVWNALPAAEAAAAVVLGIGFRPVGAVAASALFGAFAVVLSLAYRRGARGDCNCFGAVLPIEIGPLATARAAVLALASVALFVVGNPLLPTHPFALAIPLAGAAVVAVYSSLRLLLSS